MIGFFLQIAYLIADPVTAIFCRILLVGYTIMAVAMMCVAVFMSLGYSMAAIACVLLFIVAFAFSAGPVVWVLCAEIQPLRGRDFGIPVQPALTGSQIWPSLQPSFR